MVTVLPVPTVSSANEAVASNLLRLKESPVMPMTEPLLIVAVNLPSYVLLLTTIPVALTPSAVISAVIPVGCVSV